MGSLRRKLTHSPISSSSQMLLAYANTTQRGLEFLDFLQDELTYKTVFVPVNEGFTDNMVMARTWVVCSLQHAWPNQQVLLCS